MNVKSKMLIYWFEGTVRTRQVAMDGIKNAWLYADEHACSALYVQLSAYYV